MNRLGATQEEWNALSRLVLPDLLPVVADLNTPIHASSQLRTLGGKVPTFVHASGKAMGMPGWTSPKRKTISIEDWSADPRHGIGMVCRTLRVLDVDIVDVARANEIEDFILDFLGVDLPRRDRPNTGKFALFYRLEDCDHPLGRGVVTTEWGDIEFLGDRQFCVLAGTHESGVRYCWPDGIPLALVDVPAFPIDKLLELYSALTHKYTPSGHAKQWRYRFDITMRGVTDFKVIREDPVVQHCEDQGLVKGYGTSGQVFVECPWASEHTTATNISESCYYPAGINGRREPGFKCQHSHCAKRTFVDFQEAIGYRGKEITAEFTVLKTSSDKVVPADTRPSFTYKGRSSIIAPTLPNLVAMLGWTAGFGYVIRYDSFKDLLVYRHADKPVWMPVTDDTYTELRLRAVVAGMDSEISREKIRDAVSYVGRMNAVDTAQEWLKSHRWDGVPRIDRFHIDCLGLADTAYHRAVVRYLWTALAGRVMTPGLKCDMVIVFSGPQGQRKSSLIAALAPSPDETVEIDLSDRDDNLARKLRGKLTTEWTELRGMQTRDAEAIKGWITQQKDEWIPKFKEFGTSLLRRFLIIGTSNHRRFLSDPTGYRRWLPLWIPASVMFDVDYVLEWREQLWAEARERYRTQGLAWEEAETLARAEHYKAVVLDPWVPAVQQWLRTEGKDGFTVTQVLQQACSIPYAHIGATHAFRMQRTLAALGWTEDDQGRWWLDLA